MDLMRAHFPLLDPMNPDGWYPDRVERRKSRMSEAEWLEALVRHGLDEFLQALKEREQAST